MHMSLRIAPQTDPRVMPSGTRRSNILCLEVPLHPETTNMKLVARGREPSWGRFPTCQSRHRLSEPPDLFWWNPRHVSLRFARPIDPQAMPSVAQRSNTLSVELSLHVKPPE